MTLQPEFIILTDGREELVISLSTIVSIREDEGNALVCYTDEDLERCEYRTNVPFPTFIRSIEHITIVPIRH